MKNIALKKMMPIRLYMGMTIIGMFIATNNLGLYHCLGASSLNHAFLIFVGSENRWISLAALVWMPLCVLGMIVGYILAQRNQKYVLFSISVGLDLLVSFLAIIFKVGINNYVSMEITVVGLLIRVVYYMWMLHCLFYTRI